jgi:hypothetical protein
VVVVSLAGTSKFGDPGPIVGVRPKPSKMLGLEMAVDGHWPRKEKR